MYFYVHIHVLYVHIYVQTRRELIDEYDASLTLPAPDIPTMEQDYLNRVVGPHPMRSFVSCLNRVVGPHPMRSFVSCLSSSCGSRLYRMFRLFPTH